MSKRYTLTDCYALFLVDPKTFRRWLNKAKMVPQASRADDRVKYLTEEQVQELATLHERQLPATLPQETALLSPGTYKLVVDQIEELEQTQKEGSATVQALQKSATVLMEEVHQYRNEQDVQRTSLETLRILTDHHFKETEHLLQEQGRELREQKEELKADIREQVERVARSVKTLSEQMERQQQETEQTIKSLEQQFKEKIAYLELAVASITEAFAKERGARQALEQQVATLRAERKPVPKKTRESQGNSGQPINP